MTADVGRTTEDLTSSPTLFSSNPDQRPDGDVQQVGVIPAALKYISAEVLPSLASAVALPSIPDGAVVALVFALGGDINRGWVTELAPTAGDWPMTLPDGSATPLVFGERLGDVRLIAKAGSPGGVVEYYA